MNLSSNAQNAGSSSTASGSDQSAQRALSNPYVLSGDASFGKQESNVQVYLAFSWTPAIEEHPKDLLAIQKYLVNWATKSANQVIVICTDLPADERDPGAMPVMNPGIFVHGPGDPYLSGNPGEDLKMDKLVAFMKRIKP